MTGGTSDLEEGDMSMKRLPSVTVVVMLAVCLLLLAVSCGDGEQETGKVGLVVTILPQVEFATRVGGNEVEVTVMVPEGASPHLYEPTPGQMTRVSEADIYAKVGSGVEFELVWMDRIAEQNQDMLLVDCSEGIDLIEMAGSHGEEGGVHHQGAADPHIWMSPINAKLMVQNLCDGLKEIDPENSDYYEANCAAYLDELDKLHEEIFSGLTDVENRRFMVYHPSFGYFAEEYDLEMIAVEEGGKDPTAKGMARLIDQAIEEGIDVVFTSPQFNPQSAQVIADEIGGTVISVDPLARDYAENMRSLKNKLVEALE